MNEPTTMTELTQEPISAVVTPTQVESAAKPGWQTSEFAGKCAVQLIGILVLFGWIPLNDQTHAQEIALALIAASESFYGFARAHVKKGIVE